MLRHYDDRMRTTLTLEPDLAERLKELAHQRRTSFKEVVNHAIRIGLTVGMKPVAEGERFRVEARHCGFRPGIDVGKLNQLLDDLDADDFQGELRS